jgi:hypothetical protein
MFLPVLEQPSREAGRQAGRRGRGMRDDVSPANSHILRARTGTVSIASVLIGTKNTYGT